MNHHFFDRNLNDGLSKFFSGKIIKDIYPMVDKIEVLEFEDLNFMIFKIYLNDPTIDKNNMYKKGLDPHYLVDTHAKKYLKYFGIPTNKKFGFVVISPLGEKILDWI